MAPLLATTHMDQSALAPRRRCRARLKARAQALAALLTEQQGDHAAAQNLSEQVLAVALELQETA